MSEDLIIESDKIDPEEFEEDFNEPELTGNIANLSAAFTSLGEVDPGLLGKARQQKLARMKRIIFDTLAYYVDCLPQVTEEEE